MSNFQFEKIRQLYPVFSHTAYLDTPTTGALSQKSFRCLLSALQKRYLDGENIDEYFELWNMADATRGLVAQMIGARKDEIVYGLSSSSLFNIFLNGGLLSAGDNVVLYDNAYPALTYGWMNKKTEGIEIRAARTVNGSVAENAFSQLVDENTKALCVCHVDMGSGYRHDLEMLGNFCRKQNILFAVDATQSAGAMQIDVQRMKIDFLTASSYKWLQNILGVGFAYINARILPRLAQCEMGWANTSGRIHDDPFQYVISPTASRFENGGLCFLGIKSLAVSVEQYLELGGREIENYILELVDHLYQEIEKLPELSVYGQFPPEHRSGIVCIDLPEDWGLTNQVLADHGIRGNMLTPGRLRIGIHYYNQKKDIDCLLDFLKTCCSQRGRH